MMTKQSDNGSMQKTPAMCDLEEAIGYEFQSTKVFTRALTHRSYRNEKRSQNDNERLEFLGDAAIDLWVSQLLFEARPDVPEGVLTRLRADLVSAEGLATLARELGVGAAVFLGRGEEASGGRDKTRLLSSTLEALMGAVLIDGGPAASEAVTKRVFGQAAQSAELRVDAKSRLQELVQADGKTVTYKLLRTEGPDHARTFFVAALVGSEAVAEGQGSSKQSAEQVAAKAALTQLETHDLSAY